MTDAALIRAGEMVRGGVGDGEEAGACLDEDDVVCLPDGEAEEDCFMVDAPEVVVAVTVASMLVDTEVVAVFVEVGPSSFGGGGERMERAVM